MSTLPPLPADLAAAQARVTQLEAQVAALRRALSSMSRHNLTLANQLVDLTERAHRLAERPATARPERLGVVAARVVARAVTP